jgi:hypothetical protein
MERARCVLISLCRGIASLRPVCVEHELNGFLEVLKAFVLGFALTIGAANFQTRCPKAPFGRFSPVNNGGKLSHKLFILRVSVEGKKIPLQERVAKIFLFPATAELTIFRYHVFAHYWENL